MLTKQSTQVAIIGAGPSGAIAAALLHQHNINVVVVEKSTFPRFSIGESLLPACMEVIKKANMVVAVEEAEFQFKNGAAFHFDGQFSSFDFTNKFTPGAGTTFQVQRADFDKVLADQAAEQGVEIRYQHNVTAIDLENRPLLTIEGNDQQPYQLEADFVLDASGFGRVLPRLLNLEQPSTLPPRKAIFTHIEDNITADHFDRDKILISIHPTNRQVWFWLIPFSNGTCSLGVVGEPDFFKQYPDDTIEALKQIASEEMNLNHILAQAVYPNPGGDIMGYSANVTSLCSDKFALLGNAGEFLDPVFSSGVTIAMKSAEIASELLVAQFSGQQVDWNRDYTDELMRGVDAFRCYVEGWYSGEFQDVVLHQNANPKIKQMICSILAGYAWDNNNPFVTEPHRRLTTVVELCR
ncbi:NAD(P)/FAD-dependent oxidoreductase [Aliivibrio kagoshimensis]|uniref:NAD(P)/FAD-dependent oxidoreductase n=1 Tax=Aliivibrio kagoshimensis TaxID=2910230 RepID=UPI003D0BBA9E